MASSIYKTILKRGREEGREEGLEEGREEGREQGLLEGQRALVLRLLRDRFSRVPRAITASLKAESREAILVEVGSALATIHDDVELLARLRSTLGVDR